MKVRSNGMKVRSTGMEVRSNWRKVRSNGMEVRSSGRKVRSNGMEVRSNGMQVRSNGMQVAIKLHFCPECPSITSAVGMRHINAEESFRSLRKPIRDNPKIFTKSEKMFLKTEKIFQIVMFFGNHRWRVYQIWKTITNLDKIIKSTNIILQIPNKFTNPKIVAKSRKIFCKSEKTLLTAAAPAVRAAVKN